MGVLDKVVTWFTGATSAERQEARRTRDDARKRQLRARQAARQALDEVLDKAAGIASILLVCHEDTWASIHSWGLLQGFHHRYALNGPVERGQDGMVQVRLSGPNLVHILTRAGEIKNQALVSPTARPVARRVYQALRDAVMAADPNAAGDALPPVRIDARLPGRESGSDPDQM